ncbi:MAG: hypothetical protein HC822_12505 [Oscillochloris sp.]|nr:hypothetical protein [Oscillochloris sp.]
MRYALALCCLLMLLSGCGGSRPPQPRAETEVRGPALPGRLLFVRDGTIWQWREQTAEAILGDGEAFQPAFSPDGRRIVFVARRNGASELMLADQNGAVERQLTTNSANEPPGSLERVYTSRWVFYPGWAPDGRTIVAAAQPAPPEGDPPADYRLGLTIFSADGNPPARLAIEEGADYGRSAYGPDGTLVFVRAAAGPAGSQQIYRLEADGAVAPLPGAPPSSYDPAFSRDGNLLAFAAGENNQTDIYVLLAGSATPRRLTDSGRARAPAFAPDGSMLAFLAIAPGGAGFDLWVAAISSDDAGSIRLDTPQRLTTDAYIDADSGLSWAP